MGRRKARFGEDEWTQAGAALSWSAKDELNSPSLHQSGLPIEGLSLSLLSDLQPFVSPERNFSSSWVTQECDRVSGRTGPTIKSRFSSFFVS